MKKIILSLIILTNLSMASDPGLNSEHQKLIQALKDTGFFELLRNDTGSATLMMPPEYLAALQKEGLVPASNKTVSLSETQVISGSPDFVDEYTKKDTTE